MMAVKAGSKASSVESSSIEEDDPLSERPLKDPQASLSGEDLSVRVQLVIEQLAAADFHGRWDAVKRFSQEFSGWGDRPIPLLIQQLKTQKDTDLQWFLVRILSQFKHPSVVAALAELLATTDNEDLQQSVSQALSNMGALAIETLSKLLVPSSHQPEEMGKLKG